MAIPADVYRATDTSLTRDVAIKVLPPAFANDPEGLRRFEQEAQALLLDWTASITR